MQDNENKQDQEQQPEQHHKLLEMREEEKKPFWTPARKKNLKEWIVSFAVALLAVIIIRSFLFTLIWVDGESMTDTLQDRDWLFVTVLDMKLHGPDHFDVVITHYPGSNKNYVKRVIGLPGDTIEVKSGVLYINGEAYDEPYLSANRIKRFVLASKDFTVSVPEGCYFVMGDNRDNSNDSRSSHVGFIEEGMLVGKVRFILFPFSRIGTVGGSEVYA